MKKNDTNHSLLFRRQKTIIHSTFIGLLSLLSTGSFGQVLVSTSFTGQTLPSGWTNVANPGGSPNQSWTFNNPGGRTINGGNPGFDSDFAILDSDNYGSSSNQDADLTTAPFNASGAPGPIFLSFDNQFRECCGATADVLVYNGTTWTTVLSMNSSDGYPNPASHKVIDITSAAGGSANAMVRFHYVGDWDFWWAIDNVKVEVETCAFPGGVTVSNITNTTATINWVAPSTAPALGYEYYYNTTGLFPTAGTTASGSTAAGITTATLNSLTNGTIYYVWVRSVCSGTDKSLWTGPVSFAATPPPVNDECSNAILVTVNPAANCVNTTPGTVFGATASLPTSTCSGSPDDDVWFKFTATQTKHIISLTNIAGSTSDLVMELFSGCGGTSLFCNNANSMVATGLVIGQTYSLRVFTYTTTLYQTSTFDVCVGTFPPPPANDECVNAISLAVNPDLNCTTSTPGTTTSATQSPYSSICTGTADDDVWYKFTATSTSHEISLLNVTGTTTDMAMQLLDGCTGNSLFCSDPNSFLATGLTIGQTYFLRVYTWSSTQNQATNFSVCVGTPPPPPSNDECVNAVILSVNPDISCALTTHGTITSATQSPFASSCVGTADDDVWYRFTATQSSLSISLSNITGTTSDMVMELLDGCTGNSLFCSDPEAFVASGLVTGNSYLLRVFTYTSIPGQNTEFDICVGMVPPPPANDSCGGAINISNGSLFAGSTQSATESLAPGACGYGDAIDVWYSVTPIANGNLTVEATSPDVDLVLAALSGTCGSLTELDCADNTSSGPESLTLNNVTVGNTYYFRVYGYFGDIGNFNIHASGAPLPVHMSSLEGRLNAENHAVLTWETFDELHNAGFDLQRSQDGRTFQTIAFVPSKAANGNSSESIQYEFMDGEAVLGLVYYRFIQKDIDGKTSYSNVIQLSSKEHTNEGIMFTAQPNPVQNTVLLSIQGAHEKNGQILITDMMGRVVRKVQLNSDSINIDLKALAAGLYLVKYTDKKNTQVIKLSKE